MTAAAVRDMLGLSDRGAVRSLLALLLAGEAASALSAFKDSYDLGTDPAQVVQELLELVHTVTRAKVADADDPAMSAEERAVVRDWAARLSFANLHRLWQLLLKGLAEVHAAPVPVQAAEMALLRIVHASSLPDPAELVRRLTERGDEGSAVVAVCRCRATRRRDAPTRRRPRPAPSSGGSRVRRLRAPPAAASARARTRHEGRGAVAALPADFPALVALMEASREPRLAHALAEEVRLVDYARRC